MSVHIDPAFSVYHLVERIQQEKVSAVLNHRRTMSLISYEIENTTLIDSASTRVFAGFQQMSRFLPQIKRYTQLARRAESIYVFGIPDVTPPDIPGVIYVPLSSDDQLSKEWFLVSYGRSYASALATEELTRTDDPDETRMFKGIWTFDLRLISILEEWLTHTVDARPLLVSESDHDPLQQARLVQNILNRLVLKVMIDLNSEQAAIVQGELKAIIKDTIYPIIARGLKAGQKNTERQEDVVILFTDLRDFSSLAERMPPPALVELIVNPYLSTVSQMVYEHGGVVDKFLGDGVLAVFSSDSSQSSDADRALAAAQAILAELPRRAGSQPPAIGIGLARGPVLIGQIGSEAHREETVIGDAVNTAQRLSSLGYNNVWLSHSVYERLSQRDQLESQGVVHLKGKSEPHAVYRLRTP